MRVKYQFENSGPALMISAEDASDSAALLEFTEAALPNYELRLNRVACEVVGEVAESVIIETVPEPVEDLKVGYGPHGWGDLFTDESTHEPFRQWRHELRVRPSAAPDHREPANSFIVRVTVTTSAWEDDADGGDGGWIQLGDGPPTTVYYGEHGSLARGIRAANKAYDRSMLLRNGPEEH